MAVILETVLGDITIDLYTDERPRASLNFLKLCKTKYYNMMIFHTVQRDLVAQCGAADGSSSGGESIFAKMYGDQAKYFEAETKPVIKHKKRGLVSMVNNGDRGHGSQFFITLADDLDYLDSQGHTVFGEVSEGEEALDKINEIYCDKDNKPFQNIRILHTVIIDDPYDDDGLEIPPDSPRFEMKELNNGRLEFDDELDPFAGKTEEEVREIQAEKEAKANAQILEMIGDLPDQDINPEENVLFVCKLNPVTTDDDLEIIFSRFGPIKSCEVIRDHKTEESLQYAFIEFEQKEHCENAYFKMDNVLIDDRRIHVDFSQSVSKVKWKGKGKGVVGSYKEKKPSKPAVNTQIYGMDYDSMANSKRRDTNDKKSDRRRSPDRKRYGSPPRKHSSPDKRSQRESPHRRRSPGRGQAQERTPDRKQLSDRRSLDRRRSPDRRDRARRDRSRSPRDRYRSERR